MVPSFLLHGRFCLMTMAGVTFFLNSGLPFLTVAMIISPTEAAGILFKRPCTPLTEMTYKFLAPELSAQFITAPTGRPAVILNLTDTPAAIQEIRCTEKIHKFMNKNYTIHKTKIVYARKNKPLFGIFQKRRGIKRLACLLAGKRDLCQLVKKSQRKIS